MSPVGPVRAWWPAAGPHARAGSGSRRPGRGATRDEASETRYHNRESAPVKRRRTAKRPSQAARGCNYGWPKFHHDENEPPYVAPLETWSPAIAPAGACFYSGERFPNWRGRFFFCGLRGQSLFCATVGQTKETARQIRVARLLRNEFGRLRAVEQGPDGLLYFTTSNRDGRGRPASDDDRVLRLVPVEKQP